VSERLASLTMHLNALQFTVQSLTYRSALVSMVNRVNIVLFFHHHRGPKSSHQELTTTLGLRKHGVADL